MADKDVLTQEEIDALLARVDEGDLGADESDALTDSDVVPFDLGRAEPEVKGRLPTVERITEKFARRLRSSLPASLKIPLEIGTGGVQVVRFGEYVESLYVPTCMKLLKISPLAGVSLLTLDAKLVYGIVDRFFGGSGASIDAATREFSRTELRVVDRVVALALDDFCKAWESTLPISCEVVGHEVNPGLINFVSPDEHVLVTSFRVELGDTHGELQIAMPYASLEPFKRQLDSRPHLDGDQAKAVWQNAMTDNLLDTKVSLRCLIGQTELRLRELLRLQPGDVLDVDMEEVHRVMIERRPIFSATLGDSRGRFALEFEHFEHGT